MRKLFCWLGKHDWQPMEHVDTSVLWFSCIRCGEVIWADR